MYRYEYPKLSTMTEDIALYSGLWKANIQMQVLELHYTMDESDNCKMYSRNINQGQRQKWALWDSFIYYLQIAGCFAESRAEVEEIVCEIICNIHKKAAAE